MLTLAPTIITIDRALFSDAVRALRRLAGKAPAHIEVLNGVLIASTEQELTLRATDLDVHAEVRLPMTTVSASAPALVVSLFVLADVLRAVELHAWTPELGAQPVTLEVSAEQLVVGFGTLRAVLPALVPVEQWPLCPADPGDEGHIAVGAGALGQLIDRVRHCITADDTRYFLNGALLEVDAGRADQPAQLRASATDGHRLARATTAASSAMARTARILLPRTALRVLVTFLGDDAQDSRHVVVIPTTSRLYVRGRFQDVGTWHVVSRGIEASFPTFEKPMAAAASGPHVTTCDVPLLLHALSVLETLTPKNRHAVTCIFRPGSLVLTAPSSDGSCTLPVPTDYTGDEATILLNRRYLTSLVSATRARTCQLRWRDGVSPVEITTPDDPTFVSAVMPMRAE